MHGEFRAAIDPTREIDPLPGARGGRDVTDAIEQHVEPEPPIARAVVEVIGADQEHLKHRQPFDDLPKRRTHLVRTERGRHPRIDPDLPQLLEIGRPGRVM